MGTGDELHFLSAVELTRRLAAREVASVELLEHFVGRVEVHDPGIGAVVALDVERARARAAEADAATARGVSWGPLHGLPMTVKDAFETEGLVTTSGAEALRHHVPDRDADPVERLKAAGAVVFGKTNLPEYAADVQTYNDVYSRTNNPWAADRTVGGSSGGSAAALAAGLTGLELGSDIGGSIRIPSHFCGVFGLKPTWGIVPNRGHIPGPPGSLAPLDVGVAGPMGRSADDLALGLSVLAGPDAADAVGWRLDLPPARNGGALAGLRIATWFDDPAVDISAASRTLLDNAAAALARGGAKVRPIEPPVGLAALVDSWHQLVLPIIALGFDDQAFAAFCEMAASAATAATSAAHAATRHDDPKLGRLHALVERHRDWLGADERRHRHRAAFAELFTSYDVLLTPVTPTPAFPHDTDGDMLSRTVDVDGTARDYVETLWWPSAIGALLLPAAVAPTGRTPDGLPVGVQIVAPYLEDHTAVAGHLERLLGGFTPPPLT